MAQPLRPILKDESQRDSITNATFVDRVENALSWNQAAENVAHETAVKTGSINKDMVRGVNDHETDLMRRIAAITEKPENDSAFRTQERINANQKWVNQNLKDDLAREKAYAKELQDYLN